MTHACHEKHWKQWFSPQFICLIGWMVGLILLLLHGQYQLYIATDFWPLLAVAIGGLFILLYAQTAKISSSSGCGCSAKSSLGRWLSVALLLLPVWLTLAGPTHESLNANAFASRWLAPASLASLTQNVASQPWGHDDQATSTLSSVSLQTIVTDGPAMAGRRIATIGRTYRDPSLPDDTFLIFRFVVACCAADAVPIAVLVQTNQQPLPESDQWIRIEGRITVSQSANQPQIAIIDASHSRVKPPDAPYLTAGW